MNVPALFSNAYSQSLSTCSSGGFDNHFIDAYPMKMRRDVSFRKREVLAQDYLISNGLAHDGSPEMAAPSCALFVPPAGGYGMGTGYLAFIRKTSYFVFEIFLEQVSLFQFYEFSLRIWEEKTCGKRQNGL